MTEAERYAITVRRVLVEGEELWRATVRELPDVTEFAASREEAIDLIVDAIESLRDAAGEEGREFPEPIEDDEEFSGRVTLRMPKTLHRLVSSWAEEEGTSINSYITTTLAVRLSDRTQGDRQQVVGNYNVVPASGAMTTPVGGNWAMIVKALEPAEYFYSQYVVSAGMSEGSTIVSLIDNDSVAAENMGDPWGMHRALTPMQVGHIPTPHREPRARRRG